MYERSASVLERYFEKFFGFNKEFNLKTNYENYKNIVEEIRKYQVIATEEEKLINEFDEIAKKIENIQKAQEKLYSSNERLEKERNAIFQDLDANPDKVRDALDKIDEKLSNNNEETRRLGDEFTSILQSFIEKQKERNKSAKTRRISETNYIQIIERLNKEVVEIDPNDIKKMKQFVQNEKEDIQKDIINLMIRNGKNEKIGFNKNVIEKSVIERINIANKEAECYLLAYDRLKRLLAEIETDSVKMAKYEKALRDISVKLAFLNSEKEYIAEFLDNERLTAMNGQKMHDKLMQEACENFDLDVQQINNLYELILKETLNKGTKKVYKELYNKTYLKEIEEKEKNFEEEMTNIKLNMGTVINSNYWRIEGIKNIYNVFQDEVSSKFEKDLSEFRIEEVPEEPVEDVEEIEQPKEKDINRLRNKKFIKEDIDDFEEDDIEDEEESDFEEDDDLESDDLDEAQEEQEDEDDDKDEYEEDEDFENEEDDDDYEDYDNEDDEDYEDYEDDDDDYIDFDEDEDEDFEKEEEEDDDEDDDDEIDDDFDYEDDDDDEEDDDIDDDEDEYEDDYDDYDDEDEEDEEDKKNMNFKKKNNKKIQEDEEEEYEDIYKLKDDWDDSDFDSRLNKIKNKWLEDDLESKKKSIKSKKEKNNKKNEEPKEGIWGSLFKDNKKKTTKKEAKL